MKRIIISLSALFISLSVFSQPALQWYKSLGENSNRSVSVCQLSDNSLIIGTSVNYVDSIPLMGYHGDTDILLSKYTSNGDLIWSKVFGSSAYDECTHALALPDNSFIASGSFSGNDGDFQGLNNDSTSDGWIAKFDSSGAMLWVQTYNAMYFYSSGLCIDSMQNIYFLATGIYVNVSNPHGMMDLLVFKLDSSGNKIWGKAYGGQSVDAGYSIKYLSDSTLVVVGYSTSNNSDLPGNYGQNDAWFLKISTDGDILESKIFGGTDIDVFQSVHLLNSNSLLISGYTESNDIDIANLNGQSDILLVKTDFDGNILWEKTYGKEYFWYSSGKSCLTNENDIIIPFGSNDGYRGIGFLRLNENGDSIFFKEYVMTYGYSPLEVYFQEAFVSQNNELYFVGASRINAQFFPIADTASILVKFGDVNSIEEIIQPVRYLHYENGIIQFPYDKPQSLICMDMGGRQIALSYESGHLLPQAKLSPGIYILKAVFENGEKSFRFLVGE